MKAGDEKEFSAKFPPASNASGVANAGWENTPNNLGGKEGMFKVKMLAVQTMELPEINDEFAKGLGMFDSLVALKDNLKEGITVEKQENEKQRRRGEMLEKISTKIHFDLPEKMVSYEQERLFEDMKNGVASQLKISFEQYLSSIKKTEEEIKKSFRLEAEKRIKNFLTLRQIGREEKIEVSKEELEDEMNKALRSIRQPAEEKIDMTQLREYSKGAIFNEKVFQKLETFSK
jgi:trigger factor